MDHNYSSPSMSDNKVSGSFGKVGGSDYAFSSPGAGGAAGVYLKDQRDEYTAYHNPDTKSSASNNQLKSTEYVIPQLVPLADQDGDNNEQKHDKPTVPARPARTYQGDFDDPTTPWDGQLGYLQPFPSQQVSTSAGASENLDLGYEYIQDYIPSDPTYQSDNTNNNNRQLSMRASSQLPEDLEYLAQLCEGSWPMPPTSPPHRPSQHQQSTTLMTTSGHKSSSSPHSDAVPDPSS